MKQRQLEILLEQVAVFESPSPSLEQYTTPAGIAAELLYFALMRGDLVDTVYDLGCGTGILAIGAALVDAPNVVGFDVDINALITARQSAKKLSVDVEFVCSSIQDVPGRVHTVIMNPPFGAQVRGNDRPFLVRALEVADVIYSIHNEGSYEFIKKFISPAVIADRYKVGFPLKRTFKFHKKDIEVVNVEIYRIENRS
ncbi:MAG: methyltransferase [ANME-2 cluster archaeon]|nr:methyltransferase [ANME-2 cluster archaeon]MBC2700340.1 methyltransferase [ANME-2 cluster archaeon]MBC2707909.1 methyltransferase [ANME-2 cluster archaeon]MBC2746978.1 methyltransferase [ANME-2 cluster archaeon]MBC2761982.1 methyltransferase [ANME-2 cluster archaeon]